MNYQEYRQSPNQRVSDKVQREFSYFREEMHGIYDAVYQITIKNEIADSFSDVDYFPQTANTFMKSSKLL